MPTTKLTAKQQWFYDFLIDEPSRYGEGSEWISPTLAGNIYGLNVLKRNRVHSSTASPVLKQLVALGLAEHNHKGYYKAIKK